MNKIVVLCLVTSLSVLACSTNVMGRSSMAFMPESMLNKMGAESYADQKKQLPISKDQRSSEIVHRVAQRLIEKCKEMYPSEVEGFQWEVSLFDDPKTPNAYAMPGGKIGIYTGILPICETESGLAAVMGHEIGHAILQHGNERVTTQLVTTGAITAVGAVASVSDIFGDETTKGAVMGALGAGAQYGVVLPFSRGNESEADDFGIKLMAAAGYDPSAAPQIWQNMKKLGESGPEYMSTHPSHDRRIQDLEAQMPAAMKFYEKAPQKYGMGDRF
ncbi:M48 family metallopeptidase [Candidatus Uabimicrobium sp. HlEnr_7]|uniref:M48 family metallopeptidase n=1 Tax=Candidatus Uabimicrobium helgolandensis TaxID=3095367 RepID=UPI003557FD85